jgi:hypothetical protein
MSSFLQLLSIHVRQRWMRMGLSFLAVSLAAGCTSVKPLDPAQAAAIKNVGVISLLPTSVVYQKIGITVFNNERVEKPVASALNDAARAGAESALKRINRNVKQLDVNFSEVKALFKPGPIVFSWPPEKAKAFLVDLAKENNLDAVCIVHELFDADNGYAGVRYFLRGDFNGIGRHGIVTDTTTELYDAKGNILKSSASGLNAMFSVERPDGKYWTSKIDDSLDPATQEKVLSSMKKIIENKTSIQVQALGL